MCIAQTKAKSNELLWVWCITHWITAATRHRLLMIEGWSWEGHRRQTSLKGLLAWWTLGMTSFFLNRVSTRTLTPRVSFRVTLSSPRDPRASRLSLLIPNNSRKSPSRLPFSRTSSISAQTRSKALTRALTRSSWSSKFLQATRPKPSKWTPPFSALQQLTPLASKVGLSLQAIIRLITRPGGSWTPQSSRETMPNSRRLQVRAVPLRIKAALISFNLIQTLIKCLMPSRKTRWLRFSLRSTLNKSSSLLMRWRRKRLLHLSKGSRTILLLHLRCPNNNSFFNSNSFSLSRWSERSWRKTRNL